MTDNTTPAPLPTPTPAPTPPASATIHPPDYEVVDEALQELYEALGKFAYATDVFKQTYVPTGVDFKPMLVELDLFMLKIEQDITDSYAHILFKYGFEDDEDEEDEDDDEYEDDEDDEDDEDEEYEDDEDDEEVDKS